MKTAAIYCRVSTDNQEQEGTSLQTQLEACLKYCQDKGYEVAYQFSEAYSGLTLERPKLNELRELVRNEQVDVVVVYCLDRFSRDPTHGVILIQELEKHNVELEAVIEDIDNSELGKLISYIRGFASKLEAEKIKERTGRGRLARAKEGRMPGGFHHTYGYDYVRATHKSGGRRVINEDEAKWVRQMYQWLVCDGLTAGAIRDRLTAANAPTKDGDRWNKSTVSNILKNPAYIGKTYAFTGTKDKPRSKPKEDWIEIPDVTPAIISQELFEDAQKQLQVNRAKAIRNTKRQYLLRGHLKCRRCSHSFVGDVTKNGKMEGSYRRRYRCIGSWRSTSPVERCYNKRWDADKLETIVWEQLERFLKTPELVMEQIDKQRQKGNQLGVLETELQQIERQLKALEREQAQLLQWALKGFPEETVQAENKRINQLRAILQAQANELRTRIKASQEASVSLPKLEGFVKMVQDKISSSDYERKRMALDMLGITVWLDGDDVEITGFVDAEYEGIATKPPYKKLPLPLRGEGVRG